MHMPYKSGRHFLQIPGPTNVPDRILRAMDRPTIDHRGPEFAELGIEKPSDCELFVFEPEADSQTDIRAAWARRRLDLMAGLRGRHPAGGRARGLAGVA